MKNKSSLTIQISDITDIDKITKSTKYINLDIANLNHDVISYFLEHGKKYLYSDKVDDLLGYTYASYDDFVKAEQIIDLIYADMPSNLTKLEMAKYLYVNISKYVTFDINSDYEKNLLYNLNLISKVNNLWSSLALGCVNDKSASKIYYYLCMRLSIDIDIIKHDDEYLNKLVINNQVLIVNMFKDIPYIKIGMQTRYFATYNDNSEIDKKIKYVRGYYKDYYIDKELKNIDYTKEECIKEVLIRTKKLVNIDYINPAELGVIYNDIFDKYCSNYNIKINNLFLNKQGKFHFIMISCGDNHYSYNYRKKTFVNVNKVDIINNLKMEKIGLYVGEYIPNINNY